MVGFTERIWKREEEGFEGNLMEGWKGKDGKREGWGCSERRGLDRIREVWGTGRTVGEVRTGRVGSKLAC